MRYSMGEPTIAETIVVQILNCIDVSRKAKKKHPGMRLHACKRVFNSSGKPKLLIYRTMHYGG